MGPPDTLKFITPEEYLEMEATSLEKHEFYQGKIYVMSRASLPHNFIASNMVYLLKTQDGKWQPSDIKNLESHLVFQYR